VEATADSLGIETILDHLPHRYPFLLVDRILGWEAGTRMTGVKNVTFNEPFFQGHFPDYPIMPGVLIVEAMVQVGAILACKSDTAADGRKILYFTGIDKARFRRPVTPGDQLRLEVEVIKNRGKLWQFDAAAYVDGERAAEAQMMASLTAE